MSQLLTAETPNQTIQGFKTNRPRKRRRLWLLTAFLLVLCLPLGVLLIVRHVQQSQQPKIYSQLNELPERNTAIVFGAGLRSDGSPSGMLADRLDAAIALYKNGKAQRLMMTGDGIKNNEVQAMRRYALNRGIPDNSILLDASGLRTYDSCYRAAKNFGINQAILVTQNYHLPRALYLCNSLGVDAIGYKAGLERYQNQDWYNSREIIASFVSWLDINFIKPDPDSVK